MMNTETAAIRERIYGPISTGTGSPYKTLFIATKATEEDSSGFLGFIEKHRNWVLSSPLWLGLIFTLLKLYGGPDIQQVIQFMAPWPTVPFQR
jgi:hypothetical protein